MARSNLQILTDSLRLAGIVNEIQTPSNEDAQDALRRLNDMMLSWDRQKGIQLGFYPQTSLSANIPIDDEYFEVVTLQLAKRISEHWQFGISAELATRAQDLWVSLVAEFSGPGPATLDFVPGASRSTYDIDSDTGG